MKSWPDEIHRIILDLNGLMNRPDLDAAFLARAGVKLDRALFPLLSRIGVVGPVSVVELANLIGRDHSTVSRQIAKLVDLGLVTRFAAAQGQRARLLQPTETGSAMLLEFARTRRQIFEQRLAGWSDEDKRRLIDLLRRVHLAFDEFRLEASGSETHAFADQA
jgi:DNA-binding MarR family transcriptional regulator